MKASRWAVETADRREGLFGCRRQAAAFVAALRARGVAASATPVSPVEPSLPTIRFGAAS